MVEYTCMICNYSTTHKSKFKRHLLRKNKCKPVSNSVRDITIEDVWYTYFEETYNNKNTLRISSITKNKSASVLERDRLYCCFCSKKFNHYQSRYRHEKSSCKLKDSIIKSKNEEIQELKKEIKGLKNVTQITNNIQIDKIDNSIDNSVNITLTAYNKPDMQHITMSYLDNLFSSIQYSELNKYYALYDLIKDIHCNTRYPQNLNCYLSSIKNKKLIRVFDGEKWKSEPRDQVIKEMIEDKYSFNGLIIKKFKADKKLCEKYKSLFDASINIDSHLAEDYVQDYKKIYKQIYDKVEAELYNNKEIVETDEFKK